MITNLVIVSFGVSFGIFHNSIQAQDLVFIFDYLVSFFINLNFFVEKVDIENEKYI